MPPLTDLAAIETLYATRGKEAYGEDVSQLEHALQCAALAEAAGAAPSLIVAALLHDVGHLLAEPDAARDDRHEILGAQSLKGLFDERVRAPIGLHVSAKRWLCLREKGYLESLSVASRSSLILQGGAFSPAEADRFEQHPSWRDAVALRRWDDLAKRNEPAAAKFADYHDLMADLRLHRSSGG